MNENKKKMYDLSGPKTVEAMKKRHFDAYYCSTAAEAVEKALETLNGIIYARLPRELRRRMDESDAAVVGIDAINLIESGLDGLCRRTVAVIAPAETRVARIMARDGIPEAYARLRVRAQKDEAFYRAHCTDVLVNDCGSAAAFTEKARQALETILKEERA